MHRLSLRVLAVVIALLIASLAGGTAYASAPPSDSGWQPEGAYEDAVFPGCGSTLTVHEVINKVESREFNDGHGNILALYRGKFVVRVSDSNGRKVVLDNSGPYSVAIRSNGDNIVTVLPRALIFPQVDAEPAAFQKAGLPDVFYYTKGILNLVTKGGAERVVTKPANPVDVCTLLR